MAWFCGSSLIWTEGSGDDMYDRDEGSEKAFREVGRLACWG